MAKLTAETTIDAREIASCELCVHCRGVRRLRLALAVMCAAAWVCRKVLGVQITARPA